MVFRAAIIYRLLLDGLTYLWLLLRPNCSVAAENLLLRRQLALYQERNVRPTRTDPATRLTLAWLSQRFDWRPALVIVQPKTLVRWHRQGFRLFWRYKSRPGRPRIPIELRQLIRQMALDNVGWAKNVSQVSYCSSSESVCRREPYVGTCQNALDAVLVVISVGVRSSEIMPLLLSLATSASRSRPHSDSSKYKWSSNTDLVDYCSVASPNTLPPIGRYSNCERRSPANIHIVF